MVDNPGTILEEEDPKDDWEYTFYEDREPGVDYSNESWSIDGDLYSSKKEADVAHDASSDLGVNDG